VGAAAIAGVTAARRRGLLQGGSAVKIDYTVTAANVNAATMSAALTDSGARLTVLLH
jgi:hypothetical protein